MHRAWRLLLAQPSPMCRCESSAELRPSGACHHHTGRSDTATASKGNPPKLAPVYPVAQRRIFSVSGDGSPDSRELERFRSTAYVRCRVFLLRTPSSGDRSDSLFSRKGAFGADALLPGNHASRPSCHAELGSTWRTRRYFQVTMTLTPFGPTATTLERFAIDLALSRW